MDQSAIAQLLRSKKPAAKWLGALALLIFFVPALARIMDDPNLSTWKRIEQIAIAIGNTGVVIIAASIDPKSLTDNESEQPKSED